jgi:hypothetical protein
MKNVIKLLVMCLLGMCIGGALAVCSDTSHVQAEEKDTEIDSSCESKLKEFKLFSSEHIPEHEISKERQVEEVVALWEMFFDDDNANPKDARRRKFRDYAEHLVDYMIMYQDAPTDIGGQLPKHENTHLLIAARAAKESSLYSTAKGTRGEVGLMQVMPGGPAMAGYSAKQVMRSPRLGLQLGIRWLAYCVGQCKSNSFIDEPWSDSDWAGPVSHYTSKAKNVKRANGTCKHFKAAKKLVERTLMYRTRIDHSNRYKDDE